ncbi:hypothetical protein IGI37_002086 [Enterococcus sp. AZ194]|uniref:ADP-ribosyltransferase n=1 Tax=Enterococcus sp. AZ194 TaxID=2774629 RepID=UPI003F20600F
MTKQTPSEQYWERRRELEDKARLEMEQQTIKQLTMTFPNALKRIEEMLLGQSDLHNITQDELLSDANRRDQEKYRKYLDEHYKELMSSDEKYQEFIDEFFPSYDYAKVNRLLQMRGDIFSILAAEIQNENIEEKFNDGLEKMVNRLYASNSRALGIILGTGDYSRLPKTDLETMLNYPWSGRTFSSRLWGNVSRLEQNLSQSIVNAVASGEGVLEALKSMRGDSDISDMFKLEEGKFNRAIENLVRTEYAHFAVAGINRSLDDAGLKDRMSWSAEDERVCSVCGQQSGRHGKLIKDGWYPPYHGRCRCTVIPKMPELDESIDELYEEMFGDLLNDFAKNEFGIDLSKRRKFDYINPDNYLEFINKHNKASDEEQYAIDGRLRRDREGYIQTANSFMINQALRKDDLSNLTSESIKTIEALSRVISKNVLNQDIKVDRWVGMPWLSEIAENWTNSKVKAISELIEFMNNNKVEFVDKGFLSTSVIPAKNVFRSYPIKIEIRVPKGTNIYATDNIHESELILQKGNKYEIISAKMDTIDKKKKIVIEVMVKGAEQDE